MLKEYGRIVPRAIVHLRFVFLGFTIESPKRGLARLLPDGFPAVVWINLRSIYPIYGPCAGERDTGREHRAASTHGETVGTRW